MEKNLKKAKNLFKKGKYKEVLRLLEPRIFDYSESITFFYLLGYSCLYSLDFHGAESYLSKLLRIDPDNNRGLLGIALIHLKRNELKEAAAIYLRIQDKDPGSKEAKRGLAYLKSSRDNDRLLTFFDSGKFIRLLPRESRKRSGSVRVLTVLTAVIAVSITAVTFIVQFDLLKLRSTRPDLEGISISEIDTYTSDIDSVILLSDDEIKSSLRKAFSYIDQYRDNAARLELNRIQLSNASSEVKKKAEVMAGVLQEPTFTSLSENYTYEQVQKFPKLYDGCYVRWSGRAANISITEERITFDFLVGYEEGDILQGIIPVYLEFAASVYQNMPLEVLGQVESGSNEKFSLRAAGIHRLMSLE